MSESAAEVAGPTRPDIRVELWYSFAAQLKAYAAAASLNGLNHEVVDPAESSVIIQAASSRLSVGFHARLTRGVWSIATGGTQQSGLFDLNEDGTLSMQGPSGRITEDLDHAAIRMIASLTAAATRDETGVPA